MRYVGGKYRIRKQVAKVILDNSSTRLRYLEPFVGSASVFQEVAGRFDAAMAGDLHCDLVMMWNGLLFDGWEPPSVVTEWRYAELRKQEPSADRAFAGFGCSFGGKWFGGYARSGDRNYAMNIRSGLLKTKEMLRSASVQRFQHKSYHEWDIPIGSCVYLDPPYKQSQGYTTGTFDHDAFWSWAENIAKSGCDVFVSEYTAPESWECIMEIKKIVHLGGGSKHFDATEKIFKLRR